MVFFNCFCVSLCVSSKLTGNALRIQPGGWELCLLMPAFIVSALCKYKCLRHTLKMGKGTALALNSDLFSSKNAPQTRHQQQPRTTNFGFLSQCFDCVHTVYVWKSFSDLWGALDLEIPDTEKKPNKPQMKPNQVPLIFLLFQYL